MATVLQPREGEPYTEGDALTVEFEITQADGTTPQNLNGATVRFIAKYDRTDFDEEAVIDKSTANPEDSITITEPTNGLVTMEIETDDTAGVLEDGGERRSKVELDWAVRVTDADGVRVTPAGLTGTWPIHAT